MSGSVSGVALGAWDDYPIHQAADVLAAVVPAAAGWTERAYFNGLRPSGEIAFVVGAGLYPAHGMTECYFCRFDGDRQVNVRAWQPAPGRGAALAAGTFSIGCETPLGDWRVAVESGADSLTGRFTGDLPPFLYRRVDIPPDAEGGPSDCFRHFVGIGRWQLDGASTIARPEGMLGVRDRTWGVRTRRPRLHLWSVLRLDGGYVALKHQERADERVLFSEAGLTRADGGVEAMEVAGHDLAFDPRTRELRSGRLELRSGRGTVVVELEPVGRGIRLAGAGYDDRQGDRGRNEEVQRDEYDLADPDVAARTGRGTIDIGVRAGVSGAWSADGAGVFETAVARDHARYGRQVTPA